MNSNRFDEVIGRMERRDRVAAQEQGRMDDVRALGFVPDAVGTEITMAPARGPVRMFDTMALYPKGAGDFELKAAGYAGRKTLQCVDSFDVMAVKAARHKKQSPFNPAQIAMGRFYRDLVEKHACAGVKCSSLEGVSQGGSGGGDFMDAVLRDRDRIDVLRRRIGSGSAAVVRRQRPSSRGSRTSIFDRRLVDIVCLEDGTISDVLKSHGWSIKADLITSLQLSLGLVLDRMMGPVKRAGISAVHFGSGALPIWE